MRRLMSKELEPISRYGRARSEYITDIQILKYWSGKLAFLEYDYI